MPRNLQTYTTCAGPGTARPHTRMGGLTGTIISAWYASGTLTIVGAAAYLAYLIFLAPPWAWCATAAAIIVALTEIKHWYYNERLLCIRDQECAIGTVISEPTAAFDGDRKINLMLAPFTQLEVELELIDQLDDNRAWLTDNANFSAPFHPSGAPTLPTKNQLSSNRTLFKQYMTELEGSDPNDGDADSDPYNQIVIGLVDTLLLPTNVDANGQPKNFFRRFFRKDDNVITDAATWAAIPVDYDDTVDWQGANAKSNQQAANPQTGDVEGLNPMFRFGSPGSEPMVPYLHCEVEGNYIEILMNDLITAMAGFIAGCVVGGPVGGAIVGFLAWLFKKFFDWITGNDGDAAEPDIDWDDPDFTGYPNVTEKTGDVVVVHGHWIMDTEHHQYFEIHPVRAYYIIAHNALGNDEPVLVSGNEDQVVVGDNFDPTRITQADTERICKIVAAAEAQGPASSVPVTGALALSYGMQTRY